MFYKCKHFRIEELVDKFTFEKFGELSWQFFSPNFLMMIDGIWEYFGVTVYMNNWVWGGDAKFRGLRPEYCKIGAMHSPHRLGKGADMVFKGMSAEEVRNRIIIDQEHPKLNRITRIEVGRDVGGNIREWLHADCLNIPDVQRIKIVYP